MYEKILVGYQGTEQGRDAMTLGETLARASGAAVQIATVNGEGGRNLARMAREEGADLVVLGATHRGPLGRVVPGATVENLLALSPCAVAVAPPGFGRAEEEDGWRPLAGEGEDSGMRVVGVGFDGSAASRQALTAAAELAVPNGAALRVIAVARKFAHVPGDGAGGAATGVPNEAALLQQALHDAVAELPSAARALPIFLRGIPTVELIAAVCSGVDLLVIGSRRGGPLRRHMHGSVSNVLLAEAACPVLILPSGVVAPRPAEAGQLSTA